VSSGSCMIAELHAAALALCVPVADGEYTVRGLATGGLSQGFVCKVFGRAVSRRRRIAGLLLLAARISRLRWCAPG